MLLAMQNYPFQKGLAPMGRGAYRICDLEKWSEPGDRTLSGDIDLSDERIPAELRTKVIAARLLGGAFAQEVADQISDMLEDGRIDASVAAAVLRALRANAPGTAQGGDGGGGDGPVEISPFGEPRPVNREVAPAPPSDAAGFLYPPSLKQGRTAHGLAKRGKRSPAEMARIRRICRLMELEPDGQRPDMEKIYRIVDREVRLGLLAP
jgi:hypothetical protein